MTRMKLTKTRFRAGIWEGLLTGAADSPRLEAVLFGQALPGLTVTQVPDQSGHWAVRVPIPPEALCEGIQTILIREEGSTETLAHVALIADMAIDDDIRAEVDLLRQELDMLKRAFRRHCLESGA